MTSLPRWPEAVSFSNREPRGEGSTAEEGPTQAVLIAFTQAVLIASAPLSARTAWAAARRAMGTRNGEQDT